MFDVKYLKDKLALPISLFWGLLLGFVHGFGLTEKGTVHLLEKNRALDAAGFVALPGNGHFETMASYDPAIAGGLFFAITLGIGSGATGYLSGRISSILPKTAQKVIFAACVIYSLSPLIHGDYALPVVLLLSLLGSYLLGLSKPPPAKKTITTSLTVAAVVALGLFPIFKSELGAFTAFRNSLISGSATRFLSDYYYRWTLYPADVLKPILSKSQITAFIGESVDNRVKERIEIQAHKARVFIIEEEKGADLVFSNVAGETHIFAGGKSIFWPPADRKKQGEALKELSILTDKAKALRTATLSFLLFGLPLALAEIVVGLLITATGSEKRRAFPLAATFAVAIFFFFSANQAKLVGLEKKAYAEQLSKALSSPNPLERIYAARGAFRYPEALEEELSAALGDPLINVRYTAAMALGKTRKPSAREKLAEILRSDADWYVKERAFSALGPAGWKK